MHDGHGFGSGLKCHSWVETPHHVAHSHIKAYWIMMTPRIAQIALRFGADDIDGTVVEEKIYHDAGATTSQSLRRAELLQLIRKAGREPVERDTLYRQVTRTESTFTVLV